MGRHRKQNRVPTTTLNISPENLDRFNGLKKTGETQDECAERVFSQFILLTQLKEERDAWEMEAKEWKGRYYTKSNQNGYLQNRVEELEAVLRNQQIQVTTK